MDPFSLIIVCVAIIAIASMGFLFIRASTVEKGKLQQASSQVASLAARLEEKERRIGELTSTNTELQGELSRLHAESSSLQTERKLLEERIRTHEEDLRKLHERTRVEFENLAHKIFDEKTKSFKSQSSESLTQLLNPLSEHLKGFQKTVQESFSEETRERFSLKREIERICALNEKMTVETGNLAQALKGDVKTQGTWGEMMLERILEDSGLREGEDYILQGAGLKLRHPESGSASKPDAIVMLPQGKHIIIDSKVSLEHYRRLLSEEEDGQRELALKDYLNSIRQHVVGLESRRYQDIDGLQTPDFVFMFMPIEAAYAVALQHDSELHNFAWGKRVVLVGPWNLYATLRTVGSLWRLERQNKNAEDIARRGGALYDKFVGFLEDLKKLGTQIEGVHNTYLAARNKLTDGQGNLVRQVEMLRELGSKTGKEIPAEFSNNETATSPTEQVKKIAH